MSRPSDMSPVESFAHGTRARYVCGCHCDACRKANTEYARKRAKAIIFHGKNGLVSAEPARLHMLTLSQKGIGRRAVGAACDVADSALHAIRSGRKTSIRRDTERRILAVTSEAVSNGTLISGRETWQKIHALLCEGFTRAELARRLGYKTPAIQFRKKKVTAATAVRVERFYRQIMAGGEEEVA